MVKVEQLEMDAHRAQLTADVKVMVEKYRCFFDWDAPKADEFISDRLILQAVRQVLCNIEAESSGNTP